MKNKSKAYSSASNAKRAAKAAGLPDAVILTTAHGYHYVTEEPSPAPTKAAKEKKPAKKAAKPGPVALEEKLSKEKPTHSGTNKGIDDDQGGAIPITRKSTITNPVEWVWGYFDGHKKDADKKGIPLSRKAAIAGAVAAGIAFYTARTQYQSWKTANKF